MTDLTDDQVKALVAHFPRPQQHRSGEPLLDMVYADPGNSGFYYREEKPDSVTCYVRIDHVARALLDARADAQAAVADIVRSVWGRCEALEDEAADKLAQLEKLTDHEKGFWRGQKTVAKSIRRSTEMPTAEAIAIRRAAEGTGT